MTARQILKPLAMPLALVAIAIFFTTKEPAFLGARNLTQLFIEYSIISTLALGMFMIILTGNIDLSVGSGVGLIGGIAAVLISKQGWHASLGMSAALGVALVLWFLIGTLVVKQKVPSFIITLSGLLIFKGYFWETIDNSTVQVTPGVDENLYSMLNTYYLPPQLGLGVAIAAVLTIGFANWRSRAARAKLQLKLSPVWMDIAKWAGISAAILTVVLVCNSSRGVPFSLVILSVTALVVYFLTKHTPFGRYLYAIGGNEEAAHLSGINVDRVIIGAFMLMGVCVALTGLMTTSFSGASTTTVGDLMELDAVAACVIGGTALKGGRGTVWGVLLGALVMTALLNGMTLLAVEPEMKFKARGFVLALAVWMDVKFSRA